LAENEKEDLQRSRTKRKAALVLSIIKGETSLPEAARKHSLTAAELENWKERNLLTAKNALRARPNATLRCRGRPRSEASEKLLAAMDADEEVKKLGRSALFRKIVAEFLESRRRTGISSRYSKAYGDVQDPGRAQ